VVPSTAHLVRTVWPWPQVEMAVMEFRDELEEAGGLSRQQIEDRVRVRRAQLTVEAERAAERGAGTAAAARDGGKPSSRWGSWRGDAAGSVTVMPAHGPVFGAEADKQEQLPGGAAAPADLP
jgi:cwf21 domain